MITLKDKILAYATAIGIRVSLDDLPSLAWDSDIEDVVTEGFRDTSGVVLARVSGDPGYHVKGPEVPLETTDDPDTAIQFFFQAVVEQRCFAASSNLLTMPNTFYQQVTY